MSGDDPKKIVEFPKAELPPEERTCRLKIEVERLARLPTVEWLFYVECGDVAEKHGVSRAAMKAMVEATIRENERKAREDKAEDRQRIRRVEKDKVTAQRELAREQAKQKREQEQADSKQSPNYPSWRTRHASLNWRSGRAKTSTSCVMNSRPITFRRIWAPSLSSHGTSRSIRMHSCSS
jgi:hypothetical protein